MDSIRNKIEDRLRKSKVYKYNTQLSKAYKFYEKFQIIIDSIESKQIAIWGGGCHTYFLLKNILEKDKEKILVIIDSNKKIDDFGFGKSIIGPDDMKNYRIKTIVISSFKYRKQIAEKIREMGNQYEIVDLYDVLEEDGISFEHEFYMNVFISYMDISNDLNELASKKGTDEEIVCIKKLIGDYLWIRDFVSAFTYIDFLKKKYEGEMEEYINLKMDIVHYLEEAKINIGYKEHIVINWLDGLRQDEVENMPFLNNKSSDGISFDNAYTVTPYTNATMKTIFKGQTIIDNQLYKMNEVVQFKDSILYEEITKHNYEFCFIGIKWNTSIFYNKNTYYLGLICNLEQIPSSLLQWELICELEEAVEKKFIIVHSLAETHQPYGNGIGKELRKYSNLDVLDIFQTGHSDLKAFLINQIKESQKYLDTQLEYYYDFYKNCSYTVYMSDHGQYRGEIPICFKGEINIVFFICGKSIIPSKCQEILSLIKFAQIAKNLFEKKDSNIIEDCISEYALIQCDDVYSDEVIRDFYLNPSVHKMFYIQHRGVVTTQDAYLHYITGEEYYFREGSNTNSINNPNYFERIQWLKNLAGNVFININKEKKYLFARDLYQKMGFEISDSVKFI